MCQSGRVMSPPQDLDQPTISPATYFTPWMVCLQVCPIIKFAQVIGNPATLLFNSACVFHIAKCPVPHGATENEMWINELSDRVKTNQL